MLELGSDTSLVGLPQYPKDFQLPNLAIRTLLEHTSTIFLQQLHTQYSLASIPHHPPICYILNRHGMLFFPSTHSFNVLKTPHPTVTFELLHTFPQ